MENYLGLLVASRNLDFFTSFYRYFIQLLPAAVVAPLFFAGKIEFGVINQSQSAFNHVLNDLSLVVYQVWVLPIFLSLLQPIPAIGVCLQICCRVPYFFSSLLKYTIVNKQRLFHSLSEATWVFPLLPFSPLSACSSSP